MTTDPDRLLRCTAAELDTLDDLARHLDAAQLFLDEVARVIDSKTNPAAAHADLLPAQQSRVTPPACPDVALHGSSYARRTRTILKYLGHDHPDPRAAAREFLPELIATKIGIRLRSWWVLFPQVRRPGARYFLGVEKRPFLASASARSDRPGWPS